MIPPHQDANQHRLAASHPFKAKEDSLAHGSSFSMREAALTDEPKRRLIDRFINSFRRDPGFSGIEASAISRAHRQSQHRRRRNYRYDVDHVDDDDDDDGDDDTNRHRPGGTTHYYDLQRANLQTSHTALARKLKGRHLQMIAIGGSIGTGLFVASGRALEAGGPGSLLIAFLIVGTMLYCTCQALGELAVMFPVAGSFSSWATRFLDPSWGFAMGWNYALQWLIILPLEIIAASLTMQYWKYSYKNAIFVSIFLFAILAINMCGVRGYGEAEFLFSIIKITAVVGFILLGIVLNIGGTPTEGYIGGKYWHDPGAFHNGFKGLCSVFVTAAFAFAGTELIGLAAAETEKPRKSLPTAIKQVFWRIMLFYIVSLTLVGLLVPYNESRLLDGSTSVDAKASPFVIAIEKAGIEVLPSVMNVVILIAVLSVGNSAVFGSSRTLAALADLSQGPRILSYIDRKGRPLVAIACSAVVGLLAYLADHRDQARILDWLAALSGLSSAFTWGSICLCHIRFRRAWAVKGRRLEELPFRSQVGVMGSWVGFILNLLVLMAQFWVAAWPIDKDSSTPTARAQYFFLKYMGVPIVVSFYIFHKLWWRTGFVQVEDMDIDTGRRDFNLPLLVALESRERRSWPTWKKIYKFLC